MAPAPLLTLLPVSMSPGTPIVSPPDADMAVFDGAVCELWRREDGTFTAEVRIPARQDGHG